MTVRAGGETWITGSYDPDLNLTYWGIAQAKPWMPASRGTSVFDKGAVHELHRRPDPRRRQADVVLPARARRVVRPRRSVRARAGGHRRAEVRLQRSARPASCGSSTARTASSSAQRKRCSRTSTTRSIRRPASRTSATNPGTYLDRYLENGGGARRDRGGRRDHQRRDRRAWRSRDVRARGGKGRGPDHHAYAGHAADDAAQSDLSRRGRRGGRFFSTAICAGGTVGS